MTSRRRLSLASMALAIAPMVAFGGAWLATDALAAGSGPDLGAPGVIAAPATGAATTGHRLHATGSADDGDDADDDGSGVGACDRDDDADDEAARGCVGGARPAAPAPARTAGPDTADHGGADDDD